MTFYYHHPHRRRVRFEMDLFKMAAASQELKVRNVRLLGRSNGQQRLRGDRRFDCLHCVCECWLMDPCQHICFTQHTDVFRIADDGKRGVALFGT